MITQEEFYNSLSDEEKTRLEIISLLIIYGKERFINLLLNEMGKEGQENIRKLERNK